MSNPVQETVLNVNDLPPPPPRDPSRPKVMVSIDQITPSKAKTNQLRLGITVNLNTVTYLDDPKLRSLVQRLEKATEAFMQPEVIGSMLESTATTAAAAAFDDKWFKYLTLEAASEIAPKTNYLHMHAFLTSSSYCRVLIQGDALCRYRTFIKEFYTKHFSELKGIYVSLKTYPSEIGLQDYIMKQAL